MRRYDECRSVQLIQTEHVKGSGKSQQRVLKMNLFPTGYSALPEPGGMDDQPYRLMAFFEIFLATERNEVFRNLRQ